MTGVGIPLGADPLSAQRYRRVPQMRDYDRLQEKRWLPYVMFFHQPGCVTASFTTDAWGFRRCLWQGRPLSYDLYSDRSLNAPRGAVVGSSAAFGVGVTGDEATLPSRLNQSGTCAWFNFSGRAYNSTQELLIFLLHLPERIEKVLLFTGVNQLVLSEIAEEVSPVYNAFYFQSQFERGLNRIDGGGLRGAARHLTQALQERFSMDPTPASVQGDPQQRYARQWDCFQRDLRIWRLLREALGFDLYLVLQPVAVWLDKPLSPEEAELFALLDALSPVDSGRALFDRLEPVRGRYQVDLRDHCAREGIAYLDLNELESLKSKEWLFVDRVHLTDAGTATAADEIRKRFSL